MIGRLSCVLLIATGLYAQNPAHPTATTRSGFTITGTLVNAANLQPVPHAKVTLSSVAGVEQYQVSDEEGHFAFSGLAAMKYRLAAEARGFSHQAFEQHEYDYSTAIAVGPKLNSENLVFRLLPDATIVLRVVDEFNDPVRNGDVQIIEEFLQNGARIAAYGQNSTNDEGICRLALSAARYVVSVSGTPWYAARKQYSGEYDNGREPISEDGTPLDVAYPTTYYPGVTDRDRADVIVLHPGEQRTLDITLHAVPSAEVNRKSVVPDREESPQVTITGKVTFDGLAVIPETAAIEFHDRQKRRDVIRRGISQKGEFQDTEGILPGTYDVVIFGVPDYGATAVSATGTQVVDQTAVVVGNGGTMRLEIAASHGMGVIEGIAWRGNRPVGGAMILLWPQDPGKTVVFTHRDQSDSDGSFILGKVFPGAYRVIAIENGWDLEWSDPAVVAPYLARATVVKVADNGKYKIKVEVQ